MVSIKTNFILFSGNKLCFYSGSFCFTMLIFAVLFIDRSFQGKFQQDCLQLTNKYRAKHHSPPLVLDPGVSSSILKI